MKGVYFTIITFVIFLGIIIYVSVIKSSNIETSKLVTEKISAERIFYTWKSVYDNMKNVLNIYIAKVNDTIEINDTLPADSTEMIDFLSLYQQFINRTYKDPTIDIRFEDSAGNEVILNETTLDPKTLFTIKPMNINYGYPDYGKNELFVKSSPENFSFIKKIDLYIKLKNVIMQCDPVIPGDPHPCEKWNPDKTDCSGVEHCLNLNLTFEDKNNKIYNFIEKYFDEDDSSGSKSDLNVWDGVTAAYSINILVGPLPTALNIKLHEAQIDSSTEIQFNTTDFYINLASILNVSTPFGKKVDNL